MQKFRVFSYLAFIVALTYFLGGCGGGGGLTITVTAQSNSVQAGTTTQVTATVTNDSAMKGVTWTVTCSVAPCGSVAPASTASGTATTYTAPPNPPANDLQVTITATSVTDSTKSKSVIITVPAITVSVAPSNPTVLAGNSQQFTATVANTGNTAVTWKLTVAGAACSPGCGTLNNAGTNPTTYTAPGPPASTLSVTITATSVADNTKFGSTTITVLAITVSVAPPSVNVPVKGAQQFTATVSNDASNKGVTWALLQGGVSCTPGCGTIAPAATPSGTPATYTAPATVPANPAVTVKATSVADGTKSGLGTATVVGITVSVSPPTANVVVNAAQQFIGTVTNDVTNSGVTWKLTQVGVVCSPTCGTISPAATASGTATTYTAPAAVPNPATVTVTATSVADASKSNTATVTVTPTPPVAVTITTQPANSVQVNKTTTVVAHVANDPANKGVDWSLMCTQGGAACGSITAHTASDATATYTAPPAVPTSTVTIKATSTADNTKSVTANVITITAAGACNQGPTTLCGRFTFWAQGGPAGTLDPLMVAGTFTADGVSGITDGTLTFNSDGLQLDDVAITPVAAGAWNVGADGRGTITITTATAINTNGKITFTFALNSTGTFAFIFESDDSNGTGLHQSGFMQAADKTKFNAASIHGGYGLGLVGGDGLGSVGRPRAAMLAGISTSGADCGITSNGNSVFIIHDQGTVAATPIPFACTTGGLSTIDATTGHGTVTITFTGSPFSSQAMNFAFYVIDATKLIFISTDTAGANLAIMSGEAFKQAKNAFALSDVACGFAPDANSGCVFAFSGEGGSGGHISAGRAVGTASGVVTLQEDDNNSGSLASMTIANTAVSILNANAGLGLFTPPGAGTNPAAFVLIDADTGILGIADGSEQVGMFKPQTATAISGSQVTYILGSQLSADGKVGDASGVVTLAKPAAGQFAGTVDVEVDSAPFQVAGFAFTGTYVPDAPATGRATGTSNAPGITTIILWVVSPSEVVILDTEATLQEPVLLDIIKQ